MITILGIIIKYIYRLLGGVWRTCSKSNSWELNVDAYTLVFEFLSLVNMFSLIFIIDRLSQILLINVYDLSMID